MVQVTVMLAIDCGLVNTVFLIIYLIDDKGKGIIKKIVYSILVKPA